MPSTSVYIKEKTQDWLWEDSGALSCRVPGGGRNVTEETIVLPPRRVVALR